MEVENKYRHGNMSFYLESTVTLVRHVYGSHLDVECPSIVMDWLPEQERDESNGKRTKSSSNETGDEQLPSGEHVLPFGQQ